MIVKLLTLLTYTPVVIFSQLMYNAKLTLLNLVKGEDDGN
jgi:hypothetical protein